MLAFSPANQDWASDVGQRMKRGHREGGAKFPVSWLGLRIGRTRTQTRSSTCTKDWIGVKGYYCCSFQARGYGSLHCWVWFGIYNQFLLFVVSSDEFFLQILPSLKCWDSWSVPHDPAVWEGGAAAWSGRIYKYSTRAQHVIFQYRPSQPPPQLKPFPKTSQWPSKHLNTARNILKGKWADYISQFFSREKSLNWGVN